MKPNITWKVPTFSETKQSAACQNVNALPEAENGVKKSNTYLYYQFGFNPIPLIISQSILCKRKEIGAILLSLQKFSWFFFFFLNRNDSNWPETLRFRFLTGTYEGLQFFFQSLFPSTDFAQVFLKVIKHQLFSLQLFGDASSLPDSYMVQKPMDQRKQKGMRKKT